MAKDLSQLISTEIAIVNVNISLLLLLLLDHKQFKSE